jgi:hypothetical protein
LFGDFLKLLFLISHSAEVGLGLTVPHYGSPFDGVATTIEIERFMKPPVAAGSRVLRARSRGEKCWKVDDSFG